MRRRTALAATAFLIGAATSFSGVHAADVDGAVFTMTNSGISGNQIVAYERFANGTLHLIGAFPTGGTGAGPAPTSSVFGAPIAATADSLGSQNSLILSPDHRFLLAVNAGSNTVSCLQVNADGPGPLLSGPRTVNSGGVFPVSLTLRDDRVLYVLNSGESGNITAFRLRDNCELVRIQGGRKSLAGLVDGPPFPSPEPNEVLTTPGQVGFTPDGKQLVVVFKGGPEEGDPPGLPGGGIVVFGVDSAGRLTGDRAVTEFDSTGEGGKRAGPFSFVFDANGNLLVNHANSFSFAAYRVQNNGRLTAIGQPVPISGLANGSILSFGGFNCWVVRRGNTVYVMSFGDIPATNGNLPDGPGVISALRVAGNGSLSLLNTGSGRPRGVVAVLPQDNRNEFASDEDGTFGNHGIDMAVVESGGRAFLYAIEPRVGQIGAWEINSNGTLRFIRNFDGRIREGVDPFAVTNPGIVNFTERCFLQRRSDLSPECRQGSAQGIVGF